MSHKTDFLTINKTRVRLLSEGTGSTALCLHGGAGVYAWTPFFQAIAERTRLLVPEHPGFGQSDNPSWLTSVQDLAMFYLDLLKSLNLGPVHLIGNSFGGWIASEIAVMQPESIRSLTLIGPAGLKPDSDWPENQLQWTYEEATRNLFHDQSIAEATLARPISLESMSTQIKNLITVARLGNTPCLHRPALVNWLHRLDMPTQIIWGREDKLMPASTALQWKRKIPHSTVTIVDGVGHLPHAEKPIQTAGMVTQFIQAAENSGR